jgi:hypothetical protein
MNERENRVYITYSVGKREELIIGCDRIVIQSDLTIYVSVENSNPTSGMNRLKLCVTSESCIDLAMCFTKSVNLPYMYDLLESGFYNHPLV